MGNSSVLLLVTLLVCAFVFPAVDAGVCTGTPLSHNGLPCATTTRYEDNTAGACGCSGSPPSFYTSTYTAAASQLLYNPSDATVSWCGTGCGTCWELTPTGDCPTGSPCATSTSPIVIMITNLCPYNGNQQWCPNPGSTNTYGYQQHFDLWDQNMAGKISALGWNNPVVTYKQVPCGQLGAPTCSNAGTCSACSDVSPNCAGSGGTATVATTGKSTTTTTTGSSSTTGGSTTHNIYTSGAFNSAWADWSSPKATAETTQVHSGTTALSYTCNNWNLFYVHVSGSSGITGMTKFTFYLYRTSSTQPLQVLLYLYGATSPVTTSGAAVPSTTVNSWVQVSVTIASLGGSTSSAVGGFAIQAATASNDGTYYIDDIAWS